MARKRNNVSLEPELNKELLDQLDTKMQELSESIQQLISSTKEAQEQYLDLLLVVSRVKGAIVNEKLKSISKV